MDKKMSILMASWALVCAIGTTCLAQESNKATTMTASLNKTLGIFIFPAKQQDAATQSQDEQACYSWGVEQSGVDPLNRQATAPDEVDKSRDGTAVKGAARGAVAGLAIGAIAGDAGKGAAIGAAGGGVRSASGKRKSNKDAEQDAKDAATQKDQTAVDSFKKAYSACLEGKGYTVK